MGQILREIQCDNAGSSRVRMGVSESTVYRVTFLNQGEVYEVYARSVSQAGIFGFVEIADLIFQDETKKVIDPSRERIANEFEGVPRTLVPLHAVLRIDQVEREGEARITLSTANSKRGEVRFFPTPMSTSDTES